MDEWGFSAGDEVELCGLSKVELNGVRGTLLPLEFPEQAKALGRLPVMLTSGKQLSIKVENLKKITLQEKMALGYDVSVEGRMALLRQQSFPLKMPTATLQDRGEVEGLLELPAVGLGTSLVPEDLHERVADKDYRRKVEELTEDSVAAALEAGIRLFDCSNSNINQQTVGRALEEAMESSSICRRDLFIVGRLWRCRDRDEVRREADKMLSELRLEYVDLLVADIPPERAPGTWCWLEDLCREGRTRYLGVCNFDLLGPKVCVELFREFMAQVEIMPAVHCMEVHPLNTNDEMSDCCKAMNVQIMASSPLGAPHKIEAFMKCLTKSDARDMRPLLKVPENPIILDIAKNHRVSPTQIALRWNLQRGHSVIPKSFDPVHIRENSELFHFCLTPHEMNLITSLHKGVRSERFFQQAHCNGSKALPKMTREAQDACEEILKKMRGGAKTEEAKMRADIANMIASRSRPVN